MTGVRIILALGLLTNACAPVRTRVSGELVWTRPDTVAAAGMEEMAVGPGDVRPARGTTALRVPRGIVAHAGAPRPRRAESKGP